ncbi:hypothetical protein TNCV_2666291 [Trichonephila clavipes]|nr:hypothetical protein TNCV_2666291 [Trichonephila clavipes]
MHARLELYKDMVAQPWPGLFFRDTGICVACLLFQCNSVHRVAGLSPSSGYAVLLSAQSLKIYHAAPMNLTEVWTTLANIWQVTSIERFHELLESMPRRVATLIKARRGITRY